MAVLNLVEQAIIFISVDGIFDEAAIFSNALVQTLINNSAGQKVEYGYRHYADFVTGTLVYSSFFELRGFFLPAFQATIQQNIPALAAAFPQYTIVTSGAAVQFGN